MAKTKPNKEEIIKQRDAVVKSNQTIKK